MLWIEQTLMQHMTSELKRLVSSPVHSSTLPVANVLKRALDWIIKPNPRPRCPRFTDVASEPGGENGRGRGEGRDGSTASWAATWHEALRGSVEAVGPGTPIDDQHCSTTGCSGPLDSQEWPGKFEGSRAQREDPKGKEVKGLLHHSRTRGPAADIEGSQTIQQGACPVRAPCGCFTVPGECQELMVDVHGLRVPLEENLGVELFGGTLGLQWTKRRRK